MAETPETTVCPECRLRRPEHLRGCSLTGTPALAPVAGTPKEQEGECPCGGPHYCPNCDNSFYARSKSPAPALAPLGEALKAYETWLVEEGHLKALGIVESRNPSHGTCCTCGTCGQFYDDCVCESNAHWREWNKVKAAAGLSRPEEG